MSKLTLRELIANNLEVHIFAVTKEALDVTIVRSPDKQFYTPDTSFDILEQLEDEFARINDPVKATELVSGTKRMTTALARDFHIPAPLPEGPSWRHPIPILKELNLRRIRFAGGSFIIYLHINPTGQPLWLAAQLVGTADMAGETTRNKILEEAAAICDKRAGDYTALEMSGVGSRGDGLYAEGAKECARAIRAEMTLILT